MVEFPVSPNALLPPGTAITANHFTAGQYVDVQGMDTNSLPQEGISAVLLGLTASVSAASLLVIERANHCYICVHWHLSQVHLFESGSLCPNFCRHNHRQRIPRCHEEVELCWPAPESRQLQSAQISRQHRTVSGPWEGVPGEEDGWPHGRGNKDCDECPCLQGEPSGADIARTFSGCMVLLGCTMSKNRFSSFISTTPNQVSNYSILTGL